tara:strand:+ start:28601 stop:28732 length:132 start_codon:yes stop_codon:yes gene_type:complete
MLTGLFALKDRRRETDDRSYTLTIDDQIKYIEAGIIAKNILKI